MSEQWPYNDQRTEMAHDRADAAFRRAQWVEAEGFPRPDFTAEDEAIAKGRAESAARSAQWMKERRALEEQWRQEAAAADIENLAAALGYHRKGRIRP